MESLLFMLDACAIVMVVFFSVKNDRLRAGMPQVGLFRTKEGEPAEPSLPRRDARSRPMRPAP